MTVARFGLGASLVLVTLILALFAGTRGESPVAVLVSEDSTLPSQEIAGIGLHMRTEEGPPDAKTTVDLQGGADGDLPFLMGLAVRSDTHAVVFYDRCGAGLSERLDGGGASGHDPRREVQVLPRCATLRLLSANNGSAAHAD